MVTEQDYAQWIAGQVVPAAPAPEEPHIPTAIRAPAMSSSYRELSLPTDSAVRKGFPIVTGCMNYFPAALAGVAAHSKMGNDKHNPGQPLHHARGKSADHADCIGRHLMDLHDLLAQWARNGNDGKVVLDEANALAWRALALSQELHEQIGGAPLAPAARVP